MPRKDWKWYDFITGWSGGPTFFHNLFYAFRTLNEPPTEPFVVDDRPPTLATRGTSPPYLPGGWGRVAPLVAWAGDRFITEESVGGAKKGGGGDAPESLIYYESGWHVLCAPGPIETLDRIYSGGEILWEGPINRESTPSGSWQEIGYQGKFKIYWGEPDQPIDTYLADQIGVNSSWPYLCYVLWARRRLGPVPVWGAMDYVISSRAHQSALVSSPGWRETTRNLNNDIEADIGWIRPGVEDYGFVRLRTDPDLPRFRENLWFKVENNGPEGSFQIKSKTWDGATQTLYLFPFGGVPTGYSSGVGEAHLYNDERTSGANAAHIIYQLLFAAKPYGMGLDQNDWDLASLETLGSLLATEEIASSAMLESEQRLGDKLSEILSDIGCAVSWDPATAKYKFVPTRGGTVETLTDDDLVNEIPSIEVFNRKIAPSRFVFTFKDQRKEMRVNTVNTDEDSRAGIGDYAGVDKNNLPTISDLLSAQVAASIQARVRLGELAGGDFVCARKTRPWYPGMLFSWPGVPWDCRIVSVKRFADSPEVEISATSHSFDADDAEWSESTYSGAGTAHTEFDLIWAPLELPAYAAEGKIRWAFLRVRGNPEEAVASVYSSTDGASYTYVGKTSSVGGGVLGEAWGTDGWIEESGPLVTLDDLDASQLQDLSGDEEGWWNGKQIAVIGGEVVFLRGLTWDEYHQSWRMSGVIRGRYGTSREAWSSGDGWYLWTLENREVFQAGALGQTLYFKVVPPGLTLDVVEPVVVALTGRGVRPLSVAGLRVDWPWVTGDLTVRWNWRSASYFEAGAGQHGAGTVTAPPVAGGGFYVRFYDATGLVLKHETLVQGFSYVYDSAQMAIDYAGAPDDLVVSVVAAERGLFSDDSRIDIERGA